MKTYYIIEHCILGDYSPYDPLKINYYDGGNPLCPYSDNINDAIRFDSIEDAQQYIESLKRLHPIRSAWRHQYNIINY